MRPTHISAKVGDVFGRWTVVGEPVAKRTNSNKIWYIPVKCECGRRVEVNWNNLRYGKSSQCTGCSIKKMLAASHARGGKIKAFGKAKSALDWEKDPICKVSAGTIRSRLRRGAPPEMAISTPVYEFRFLKRGVRRKLSDENIREIYLRLDLGERGADLSEEYGVSRTTISHIKTGKIYAEESGFKERHGQS